MSSFKNWLYGILLNAYHVFFQKLGMRHLPSDLDAVGGPVAGLNVIVTGPTAGIGKQTAASFARRGANVTLACRDLGRGRKLQAELQAAAKAAGHGSSVIEVQQLDVSSVQSVRAFAAAWDASGKPLHILVNNAGVLYMTGGRTETVDGFESHMGTNHLCPFLLTLMLLPALRRGGAQARPFTARVVNVSSMTHFLVDGVDLGDPQLTKPGAYAHQRAYAQSKLAQVQFTAELRRRLSPSTNVSVTAVHPGMVATDVVRSLPPLVQKAYHLILGSILLTPDQGARATMHAATSPDAPAQAEQSYGYFDANCTPTLPNAAARDKTLNLWLWRWSAEAVQLPPECNVPERL